MDTATEPSCPSCRAAWSRSFLNEHLTAAFRNGPFKLHREKVLVDRERSRFPETQEQAAAYKVAVDTLRPIDEEIQTLNQRIDTLPSKVLHNTLSAELRRTRQQLPFEEWRELPETKRLRREIAEAAKTWAKEEKEFKQRIKTLNRSAREHRTAKARMGLPLVVMGGQPAAVTPRAVFIHKCPVETCEGFLNTQWNCGLCRTKVCKDCHEPNTDTTLHLCDPELVESIKAIRKEAKPCPRCASQISKIDGCDQMWCTQCKTAFSWNTGRVETNVIHNPHYFQWMRENGTLPRGDVPLNMCGGDALDTRLRALRSSDTENLVTILQRYLRMFRHFQQIDIPSYRRRIETNEGEEMRRRLRVQRMVNEITDSDWKITLQRREKETIKNRERMQILEMYSATGTDILGQLVTGGDLETVHTQIKTLHEFTDAAVKKLSETYNCVSMLIDPKEREVGYIF